MDFDLVQKNKTVHQVFHEISQEAKDFDVLKIDRRRPMPEKKLQSLT